MSLSSRFVFNIFMCIFLSIIMILALSFYTFFSDAFVTLDKVQEVIFTMQKEISLNNGFLPEHMTISSSSFDDTTWSYTLSHYSNYETLAIDDRNLMNNGADKNRAYDTEVSYTKNLYQSLLLDAISSSDVFTDAYVYELKGISTSDYYSRSDFQFSQQYDSYGNLMPVTTYNKDILPLMDECYIAGQKGDWIEVTVVLHTSRNFMPIAYYDGGEGLTISNVPDEGNTYSEAGVKGHDIEIKFTVPCMRYVSSGRLVG